MARAGLRGSLLRTDNGGRRLARCCSSLQEVWTPETPLGFSTIAPERKRILSARELTLIAHRHGLTLISPGDGVVPSVCVRGRAGSGVFLAKR